MAKRLNLPQSKTLKQRVNSFVEAYNTLCIKKDHLATFYQYIYYEFIDQEKWANVSFLVTERDAAKAVINGRGYYAIITLDRTTGQIHREVYQKEIRAPKPRNI